MCGMLHCTHRNEKLMFWSEQMSYTMPSSWLTVNGDKARCLGAVLDVGLDMFDPGMVPNGAKCGDNKVSEGRSHCLISVHHIMTAPSMVRPDLSIRVGLP